MPAIVYDGDPGAAGAGLGFLFEGGEAAQVVPAGLVLESSEVH